jgi:hypothetical protein
MARTAGVNTILDKYEDSGARLRIGEISEEGYRSILIEGNRTSLVFLSELLQAVAAGDDCGVEISPNGPGNLFFAPESKLGLYLHLIDGSSEHDGVANE